MRRPTTAVAGMMLWEEGRLRLDEPVDRLLPELANRKVLKDPAGPLDTVRDASRAISVRDLLTYRMGIGHTGYSGIPDEAPIAKSFVGVPPGPAQTPDEYTKPLARLPLCTEPADRFPHNTPSS